MKPDRIVINGIPLLSKLTGIGRYTFEICKRLSGLAPDSDCYFFYGYYSKKLYMTDIPPAGKMVKRIKNFIGQYYPIKKTTRETLLFLSRFSRKTFDLYWEPNNVPIRHIKSRHLVTTLHDFSFHHHPECLPKENKEYLQKHFWKNIGKSDRIITDSYRVKNELAELLNYDDARIKVIYLGVDHDTFRKYDYGEMDDFRISRGLPEKFILFVGSIEPRKNLKNALLAYDALPDALKKEYKFVLAGFSGWKNAEIMRIIKRGQGNIVYLGYLSNVDLAYLYNLASVFIYPSLYEGFGLPPLEAMACGTPVIVSNTSSIPEICGDAAYYVEPLSIDSISAGIRRVIDDTELGNSLVSRGLDRAKTFNWDTTAQKHLSLFSEVLGK